MKNKEVVLAALQRDGRALNLAAEKLRSDEEVVLAAIQKKGP